MPKTIIYLGIAIGNAFAVWEFGHFFWSNHPMKLEKLFRFWLTVSGFWMLFALIMGGARWKFPYSFQDCWEKQRLILRKPWN